MKHLLLVCILLTTIACSSVQTTVTRKHNIENFKDKNFVVLPMMKSKSTHPDFAYFKELISVGLSQNKLKESRNYDNVDYLVRFDFDVLNNENKTGSTPIIGQVSGQMVANPMTATGAEVILNDVEGSQYQFPVVYGVVGSVPFKEGQFVRVLSVEILDEKNYDRMRRPKRLYTATAVAVGKSNQLRDVASCLVNALLEEFPGSKQATVKLDQSGCK